MMGLKEFIHNEDGLFPPLLPIFQHSILPFWWYKYIVLKHVFSSSYGISETFNYITPDTGCIYERKLSYESRH
ncbi:MAG: hypothetical protein SRB2_04283 [Desulfobacteraceae bacterium Eth-SRB2]|nr:MAG: hypothetical protein SRB2_04283 [Desulfobacteraceae bacterium Eth-SRB2]